MKEIIFKTLKRVIIAICIIYLFDIVANGLDIFIPINIITITTISFLGISGLLAFIAINYML